MNRGGLSGSEAQAVVGDSDSGGKNELLFSRFGCNYNDEPEMLKNGSGILSKVEVSPSGKKERRGAKDAGDRGKTTAEGDAAAADDADLPVLLVDLVH